MTWELADPGKQKARREALYALLGKLPERRGVPEARTVDSSVEGGIKIEKLILDLNGLEPVPAYFLKPAGAEGRLPLVIYNHSHGGYYDVGKEEVLRSAPYLLKPAYGEALTAEGYAVLCIDHWAFGERSTRTERQIFKEMLWRGRVMWGMMVFDSLRAVDYAASRPDVDPERIATLGMSMGSTMAWWLAALEPRIRAVVDICSLSEYDALLETGAYDGHNLYYFVPGLLEHFRAAEINALIAPRPHLSLAGEHDKLTPVQGLDSIERDMREIYRALGAEDRWRQLRFPVGHEETEEMRREARAFLRKWL
ncbi:dienelactone hydrolase-like enzyme [Thermobacillus composti KWC4]|uniref:Dienelactone hydrolase-like enzyme n=1 Tax=Thermobacillus composti (strain DSM 18247 / JCM 13945 / KWC4) TaxID=717605 RepID=L0EBE7_THECK|nr:alpha/beta fold hydrolase [Thermobacillus composti]AGA56485.1 dienelactone hydrolase-like enzyme [Thermobacillus composti KWC4]